MDNFADLMTQILDYELLCTASKVFGPYTKSDGRKIVIIKEDDGSSRTVSYPKYLVEVELGRPLDPESETVDHWDTNFDNNDLDNLRVVPRAEHSADDTRRVKLVEFTCPMCQKKFERSPRLIRDKSKKKARGPFCSRVCSGLYNRKRQLGQADEVDVQPLIQSEYYKRKYVQSSDIFLNYIIKKYDII